MLIHLNACYIYNHLLIIRKQWMSARPLKRKPWKLCWRRMTCSNMWIQIPLLSIYILMKNPKSKLTQKRKKILPRLTLWLAKTRPNKLSERRKKFPYYLLHLLTINLFNLYNTINWSKTTTRNLKNSSLKIKITSRAATLWRKNYTGPSSLGTVTRRSNQGTVTYRSRT
jgi:hypothetical protein